MEICKVWKVFYMSVKMKKQYMNKERKLWKLKRKNVVLGQQRSCLKQNIISLFSCSLNCNAYTLNIMFDSVANLSEKIGKNSAKIQRLRTQIQQERVNEKV